MRFPAFEGEWLQQKFGDQIAESGYGPRFSGEDYSFDGNVKTIRGTDVAIDGEIKYDQVPIALLDNGFIKNHILEEGDLVMITTADCGLTGVFRKQDIDFIPSAYAVRIRLKKTSHPEYYKYLFQTEIARNIVKKFIRKATVSNLPGSDIHKFVFNIPTISEQQKIASFLVRIDQRIQTQSKIIEQFKSLISKLTDQIFSDQLEFGSLKNSWCTYSVSDVLEFFPTNSISWENLDYENGAFLNLHYGMIHKSTRKLIDVNEKRLPYIKENILSKKPVCCQSGDIVFADASEDMNDVGKVVEFVNCADQDIASGLHTIHARDKMDLTITGFKAFAFSSHYFRNQIKRLAHGTKVYSISVKKLQECTIRIPSKETQTKIIGVLKGLEDKIEIESRILKQLKQQKDYLLKKMFI